MGTTVTTTHLELVSRARLKLLEQKSETIVPIAATSLDDSVMSVVLVHF